MILILIIMMIFIIIIINFILASISVYLTTKRDMKKKGFTDKRKYQKHLIEEENKKRIAEENKKRITESRKAEKKKIADEKKRIAEEILIVKKRIAEKEMAEKKRIADEKKREAAKKKREAAKKAAEKKHIADAEKLRAKLVERCKNRGLAESGTNGELKARIKEDDKKKREAAKKKREAAKKAAEKRKKIKGENEKNRKIAAFNNRIFQQGYANPSMIRKESVWIESKGKCISCKNKRKGELGFWWRIYPSLGLVLLCDQCAKDEDLIEEPSENNEKRSRTITEDIKDAVWRRDDGKCTQCGSNESLEFDHIIPHSKGGANTKRNIQILCEPCNRRKSDNIG